MSSFQCRELLAKSEVFEKQPATTLEGSEDRTRQEDKRVYHVRVLSRFACECQSRILLKLQTDRILARDSRECCGGRRKYKAGMAVPSERVPQAGQIPAGNWRARIDA
jgi:hypothetical protein